MAEVPYEYEIRIAKPEDKPALNEFTNKYFYTGEPLNVAIRSALNKPLTEETKIDSPMPYLPEELSLIAVKYPNEIIGVALNAEIKPVVPISENSSPNLIFDSIHKVLNHVEAKITELSNPENKIKEMEVRVITVHENWRNQGIGKILLEKSMKLAQERGFEQIRSICTSAYTAKMFLRCGFKSVYSIGYKDCQKNGLFAYLPKEPHTHINGMSFKF